MSNERLRSQIAAAGLTVQDVAAEAQVDPKTIERWITKNRLPHRRHRWATARLLEVDEGYLWPQVLDDPRTKSASQAEFVTLYPHRGAIPSDLWTSLIDGAGDSIDVRLHTTVLYNSIYRFDEHLLVNTHVYGFQAPQNPVMHLRRVPGGRLFDHYMQSFDRVWTTGAEVTSRA